MPNFPTTSKWHSGVSHFIVHVLSCESHCPTRYWAISLLCNLWIFALIMGVNHPPTTHVRMGVTCIWHHHGESRSWQDSKVIFISSRSFLVVPCPWRSGLWYSNVQAGSGFRGPGKSYNWGWEMGRNRVPFLIPNTLTKQMVLYLAGCCVNACVCVCVCVWGLVSLSGSARGDHRTISGVGSGTLPCWRHTQKDTQACGQAVQIPRRVGISFPYKLCCCQAKATSFKVTKTSS